MDIYGDVSKNDLVERAKELECLYLIEEAFEENSLSGSLERIASVIPMGFRIPGSCAVVIELDGQVYSPKSPIGNADELVSAITVNGRARGSIRVMYPKNTFPEGDVVFLDEETRLLETIAKKISEIVDKKDSIEKSNYRSQWKAILNLLQKTDHKILRYVCEKMLSLFAEINPNIIRNISKEINWLKYETYGEINFPIETLPEVDLIHLSNIIFENSAKCLSDSQGYDYINLWVYQGKTYDLIKIVDNELCGTG